MLDVNVIWEGVTCSLERADVAVDYELNTLSMVRLVNSNVSH